MSAESRVLAELSRLARVGQELSAAGDTDILLCRIIDMALETSQAQAGAVFLLNAGKTALELRHWRGETSEPPARVSVPIEGGLLGVVFSTRRAVTVEDVLTDSRFDPRRDGPALPGIHSLLAVPLVWENEPLGVLAMTNGQNGRPFGEDDRGLLLVLGQQASQAIHHARLVERLHNFLANGIELLVMAVERVTPMQKGHAVKVARLATGMARRLEVEQEQYQDIYYAALLHDLGTLKTYGLLPDALHPRLGAEMVRPIKILERAAALIESSHENYAATGFPRGICNQELSREARILAVAEAYISWREEREEAGLDGDPGRFLKEHEGTVDPALIDPFLLVTREGS